MLNANKAFTKANILTRIASFYVDAFFIFYIPWLIFTTFNFNIVINSLFFLCFYLCEAFFGFTIGKFIFRLKVVDINSNKISLSTSIIRNLPKLIPLVLLFTDFKINDDQAYFSFLDIVLFNIFPVIIFMQISLLISYFLEKLFLKQNPLNSYFSKSQVIIAKTEKIKSIKTIGRFFGVFFILLQFLFIISIPSFIQAETRAKISSIKSNMHNLQTMLETYTSNHNGFYPKNIQELENEKYLIELKNPCDGSKEKIVTLNSIKFKDNNNTFEQFISKGSLVYTINDLQTKYQIYGVALIDNKAIKYDNKVFYLTNE